MPMNKATSPLRKDIWSLTVAFPDGQTLLASTVSSPMRPNNQWACQWLYLGATLRFPPLPTTNECLWQPTTPTKMTRTSPTSTLRIAFPSQRFALCPRKLERFGPKTPADFQPHLPRAPQRRPGCMLTPDIGFESPRKSLIRGARKNLIILIDENDENFRPTAQE